MHRFAIRLNLRSCWPFYSSKILIFFTFIKLDDCVNLKYTQTSWSYNSCKTLIFFRFMFSDDCVNLRHTQTKLAKNGGLILFEINLYIYLLWRQSEVKFNVVRSPGTELTKSAGQCKFDPWKCFERFQIYIMLYFRGNSFFIQRVK